MKQLYYILIAVIVFVTNVYQCSAWAQGGPGVSAAPGVQLQDEGTGQGRVQLIDCIGLLIVCGKTGVTGTITVNAGAVRVGAALDDNLFNALIVESGGNLHVKNPANSAYVGVNVGSLIGLSGGVQFAAIADSGSHGSIELGRLAANTTPFIDFHSHSTSKDYDVRMIASGGTANVGEGLMSMTAGQFVFNITRSGVAANAFSIYSDISAVNLLQVTASPTGSGPKLEALGSDTNIDINYVSKGVGSHTFYTGANPQVQITNSASSVNYLTLTGGPTAVGPQLSAQGSDSNIHLFYNSKGSFGHVFRTNNGADIQAYIEHQASSVNYVKLRGGTTGNGAVYTAEGETNINLNYYSKGTGNHAFFTDSGANVQFAINRVASTVNYLSVQGSAVGNNVQLSPAGSDSDTGISYVAKGTGSHNFSTGGNPGYQVSISNSNSNGAGLQFQGNGATTPHKTIRVNTGSLQVVNDAFTAVIFQVNDDGKVFHFDGIYPGTPGLASQAVTGIRAGAGVPVDAQGNDGDYYFRSDGVLNGTLYQRRAAVWVPVVGGSTNGITDAKAIYGLTYANNAGDVTNDIDIAAGGAVDSVGTYLMVGAALTKQSDVAWAVGTNQGCLDTGAVGNSDYYEFIISRSDTGVVDYLCSLSSTAPTMPTSYDKKRLMGWFKRVGGVVVLFHTYETDGGALELSWDVPTLDINLTNTLTTSRRTDAIKVPLNLSVIADINVAIDDASTPMAWVYCPDKTDAAPSATAAPLANVRMNVAGAAFEVALKVRTSAAGLIAARANVATVDSYRVSTMGFTWGRRN